jgi:uncharacterized membrane protein HdeD (DUF308 family)
MNRYVRKAMQTAARIAEHPVATLVTGLGLFISGMVDLCEQFLASGDTGVSAYQGVMLMGFVALMRGVSGIIESFEWIGKASEERLEELMHQHRAKPNALHDDAAHAD